MTDAFAAPPKAEVFTLARQAKFIREPFPEIEPRGGEWIVKGLLPAAGYGFVAGPSQSGKSFLLQDWSLRISAGLAVLGHRTKRVGVVYIASEGANGARKRVAAWRQENPSSDCAFELIGQAPDLRVAENIEDLIAELRLAGEELSSRGETLGLVVIDTLAASMPGGNENDGGDMSMLLGNVQRIGLETGAFVLIISHTGKIEERGIRGWSGQFAGAEMVIMLTHEDGAALRVGVVKKQRDGDDGERFAFRLERVQLGHDVEGDQISSAVVAYEDAPELPIGGTKAGPKLLSADAEFVVSAYGRLRDAEQTVPCPSVPHAPRDGKAIALNDLRSQAYDLGLRLGERPDNGADPKDLKTWQGTRKKAFQRGLNHAKQAGKLAQEGDFIWSL